MTYSQIPANHLLKLDLLADSIIRDNYLHKFSVTRVMNILDGLSMRLDRYEYSYVMSRISKKLKVSSQPAHEQSRFTDFQ